MSSNPHHFESLSTVELEQLDKYAARFEEALMDGEPIPIEVILDEAPDSMREPLLTELIAAEIEHRRQKGEEPLITEYEERFQGSENCVAQAFDDVKVSRDEQESSEKTFPTSKLPKQFGRYEIESVLGQGGMGSVYLAKDQQLGRRVALKTPKFDNVDEGVRLRFLQEAKTMAALEHPNLCPIYDAGNIDGQYFITMAFIEGPTLSKTLQQRSRLPPDESAALIEKLAAALSIAHSRGIVHRDLKPSNVMFNRHDQPVILDFGLAKDSEANESTLTRDGMVVGSPAYMSPEQIEGNVAEIGPHTDVYALGVILYELISGQRPFRGTTLAVLRQVSTEAAVPLAKLCPEIDPRLEEICMQAFARKKEERFQTADQLQEALSNYLKLNESETQSDVNPAKRTPSLGLVLLSLMVLVLCIGIYKWRPSKGGDPLPAGTGEANATVRQGSVVSGSEVEQPSSAEHASTYFELSEFRFPVTRVISITCSDVNEDGCPDVVFASPEVATDTIWLSDGTGKHFEPLSVDLPPAKLIRFADLNGDKLPDLWLLRSDHKNQVFINQGDFKWKAGPVLGKFATRYVTLVDLDSDGDLDAFVANASFPKISFDLSNEVFLNDGDGHFSDSNQALGKWFSYTSAAIDFDSDGDPDIFVGNTSNSPNRLWINDGKGRFSGGPVISKNALSVSVTDFNSDGLPDLLLGLGTAPNQIWLNENGIFRKPFAEFDSGNCTVILPLDAESDGDIDVYTGNRYRNRNTGRFFSAANFLWLNDGNNQYRRSIQVGEPMQTIDAVLADFDQDGDLDLIEVSKMESHARLYLNTRR